METIALKKGMMSWNDIIIWLVAIYSVAPDYFRIAGINSPIFFEFLIIGLWAMTNRKLPVNVQLWSFIAAATFPVCISLLLHNNFSNIVSTVLEKIVLVIVIFSTMRNRKSFYKMIDAILTVELFECITAVVHFIFDFNIFSLLSNTTDTAVLGADTQYRNGMPRAEGSFGHAITFAIYLSVCAFLSLYMYGVTKKKKYIYIYGASFIALLFTQARFPTMIFIASQIVYLLSMTPKKALRIVFKISGIALVALVLAAIFVPSVISALDTIAKMFVQLLSPESIGGISKYNENENSAFAYRFEMMRILPQIIKEDILFGIGTTSGLVFKIGSHYQTSIDNQYLYSVVVNGLFGLLSTLYWIVAPIFANRKKNDSFVFWSRMAMIAYAINLFSVAEMNERRIILVLIALIYANKNLKKYNVEDNA